MNILKNKLLLFTAAFSVIFYILLALNVTPYLRGPNDIFMESHWPYYFVNTVDKLWLPVIIGLLILGLYFYLEKILNHFTRKKEIIFLAVLVVLIFSFQLALVYFSRFGITILFRRIADPGINGYFTAALHVSSVTSFLEHYPRLLITSLPQHSRGDPPGPILFTYFIVSIFKFFGGFSETIVKLVNHPVVDSYQLWAPLQDYQKAAALFMGFFLHFISALVIVPFYYLLKTLTNKKIALRSTFLWGIIPSFTLFPLIFDPLYTVFPIISFLCLVLAFKQTNYKLYFLSGITFSLGLFFNLAILPLFLFLLILFLTVKTNKLKVLLNFVLGLITIPFLLLFAGYNTLYSGLVILSSQTPRNYIDWLFYNPYDVFIYIGIPVAVMFVYASFKIFKTEALANFKKIVIAFWVMFVALILSGASRGEVGRIWLFLQFIPVGILGYFVTERLKYKPIQFSVILILVIIECIVLEEFWVPIW